VSEVCHRSGFLLAFGRITTMLPRSIAGKFATPGNFANRCTIKGVKVDA